MPRIGDLENDVRITGERYRAARSRFAATVRIFDESPARDMELTQALTAAENAFIQAWTAFSKAKDALHAAQKGGGAQPGAPRA
ncbi:MAG TPA: hypothetical protein VJR47_11660 [Stellaceae bacterium]|nr:hypothetical protein [Stellaceae bacterium]